jgi:hypothetical protein
MTFAEIAVFDVLIMAANYRREPPGLADMTLEDLRQVFDCGINTIRRAVLGLEEMRYIERHEKGWLVNNLNGGSPVEHPQRSSPRIQDSMSRSETDHSKPKKGSETDRSTIRNGSSGDPKRIDQRSETDCRSAATVEKQKDLPAPKKGKNVRKKGKKEWRPKFDIQWNGKDAFDGADIQALKARIKERYTEELGYPWANAIWTLIIEWCQDNPKKIAAKKDCGAFVLGWYRRNAKEERARR